MWEVVGIQKLVGLNVWKWEEAQLQAGTTAQVPLLSGLSRHDVTLGADLPVGLNLICKVLRDFCVLFRHRLQIN